MNKLAMVLIAMVCSTSHAVTATRPNILFIFADDWGWGDLSCHGHPYVKTPNIDRLAEEGTDFHRFTVASGVCSPSRTAVMTGHFPARYNIDGHFAWVPSNAKRNMPDWLESRSAAAAAVSSAGRLRHGSLRQVASLQQHDPGLAAAERIRLRRIRGVQLRRRTDAGPRGRPPRHRVHREEPRRGEAVFHQPVAPRAAHAVSHRAQVSLAFSRAGGARQHLRLGLVSRRRPDRRSAGRARPVEIDRQHAW